MCAGVVSLMQDLVSQLWLSAKQRSWEAGEKTRSSHVSYDYRRPSKNRIQKVELSCVLDPLHTK